MKLHTMLYDFVDVIGGAGDFEGVRLLHDQDGLRFTAATPNPNRRDFIYLSGCTTSAVDDVDKSLGIVDLKHIKKILYAPNFSRTTVQASLKDIAWTSDLKKLEVTNNQGEMIGLSLYAGEWVYDRIKHPRLKKKVDYQARFLPAEKDLEVLRYWKGVSTEYLSGDFKVMPLIEDGKLFLNVGVCETMSIKMKFAERIVGSLSTKYLYDGSIFYRLLSMRSGVKDLIVSFSDEGACRIRVVTSCAKYDFIIPAFEY